MSFFRIAHGKVAQGQREGFEMAYRKAVHATGQQRGLHGRWLMRDMADPDAYYGVTAWDDMDALKAYETGANKEIASTVAPFMAGDFTITYCEERYLWLAINDYSGA